ncbi:MAG: MgtC/SapB family protein [Anaerolineales bacterium]|nr:MgtC/SapB family protein [Anaerolineales bacterium]
MVLGAVIGLDRENADMPSGLRTHMLVAGAAALLVTLGEATLRHFSDNLALALVRSDPARIMLRLLPGSAFSGREPSCDSAIRVGSKA